VAARRQRIGDGSGRELEQGRLNRARLLGAFQLRPQPGLVEKVAPRALGRRLAEIGFLDHARKQLAERLAARGPGAAFVMRLAERPFDPQVEQAVRRTGVEP